MNRADREIASKCGLSEWEAKAVFTKAAKRHERIRGDVEALYRRRPAPDQDAGETVVQRIERYRKDSF